ncbi:hypothetical protein C4K68_13440 [Pokkaliibacter plantistimulans]|uniref:YgjP-like metallopeptidase domain-containing protein n=1 Tax=Proteobacteria bacterium 228 TaxID=2083153 RepID=A0A2S5KPR7_9PROT|nr:SprT family zinc-dependent metalloprotease [Pokkaliibacter plantistimulans]PPC76834.1 hypothetical protein C4K68_13440 [Pokkaliibacter plantistimulans]
MNAPHIHIVRSPRRSKTIALQVRDGKIVVRAPMHTSDREIQALLHKQAAWIRQHLQQPRAAPLAETAMPAELSLLGQRYQIVADPQLSQPLWQQEQGELRIPVHFQQLADLQPWLQRLAKTLLPPRLQLWSERMQLRPRAIEVKHYRSRYGCCTHDGLIRLHWGLILAPQAEMDYVLIHELAHLQHFHHQPAFWQLVSRYCPDWRRRRAWFRLHGRNLVF